MSSQEMICLNLYSITPTFTENFTRGKSRTHTTKVSTQIMKFGDIICVADFHDLFVAKSA